MTDTASAACDRLATMEDYLSMSFKAMSESDTKVPSHAQWMEQAESDYKNLVLGLASLRKSSQEFVEIIKNHDCENDWQDLYDCLDNTKKFHEMVLEDVDVIMSRLLVALCQASPEHGN